MKLRKGDINAIYKMKSEAWSEVRDAEAGQNEYGIDCSNRLNYWSGRHQALNLVCEMIERPSLLDRLNALFSKLKWSWR